MTGEPLPPTTSIAQRATVRLISSARLKPPVLAPLVDTDDELAALAALEGATSGRLKAQARGMIGIHQSELVFGVPNHTFINAAFTYTRPQGNRFNGPSRGAWYCAFAAETALEEVTFHLTRELDNIGRYDTTVDYVELLADFIGPFHDLRGMAPVPVCLDPDPAIGYPAGQALAREILMTGGNGILYPSARDRQHRVCLAALRPSLVQNIVQGQLWRLTWNGTRTPMKEAGPTAPLR